MPAEKMPVPLLDLKAQFDSIKPQVMAAVEQVFDNQGFILGPTVAQAEKTLAQYLGVPEAIGVSSGSDALLLSLMGLGVGPGDGVITTPFTFFATAGAVYRLGARPIFADIDPEDFNLDPAKVEELLAGPLPAKPKAIIPVHLFGQPARMDRIMELARAHGLAVVEDAAQAIGARYPGAAGVAPVGGLGDTGCFSFFPSKNLGAAGDGGLITASDPELAAKLRSMRTHGSHPKEKYRHIYVGGNFRLDAMQAAVIMAKLPRLSDWSDARRKNAGDYDRMFADSGLVNKGLIKTPKRLWPETAESHVYNQYVLRARDRDGLLKHLQGDKIGCAVYYPTPLHMLECFADLGYRAGDLPVAEAAAGEVIAIPVYPELSPAQKERVVEAIAAFYR